MSISLRDQIGLGLFIAAMGILYLSLKPRIAPITDGVVEVRVEKEGDFSHILGG